MTTINVDPSKHPLRRPSLRVQLTTLYAGLLALLVTAVLAVSGLPERQGSTSRSGATSSHNAIFGQHFNVGPMIVAVIAAIVAVGVAWRIAGRVLSRSATATKSE
jgi:hypothetical protein